MGMNGLEVGMRLETRRGMENRYARERANVEVPGAAFCECGLVKRGSYTDEKFTVRCADCALAIRGAFDAWTMRFKPMTEERRQEIMDSTAIALAPMDADEMRTETGGAL